jgi:hypothetical protein
MTEYMIWERKVPLELYGGRKVKVRYGVSDNTHKNLMAQALTHPEERHETEIQVYCYRNFALDPPEPDEDAPREKKITIWSKGPYMPAKEFLRLYEPTGEVLS